MKTMKVIIGKLDLVGEPFYAEGEREAFWCSFDGEMAQDEIGGTIEGKGVEPDHEV
jgi:hypothetical protein